MSNSRSPRAVRSMTIGIRGMHSAYSNDGRSLEPPGPQVGQCRLRPLELVERDRGPDRDLRRDCEQLVSVLAGEVGDRSQLALLVEQLIGEGGTVAHVAPGADGDPVGS